MSCGVARISDSQSADWWRDLKLRVSATVFDTLNGASPRLSGGSPVIAPDGRIWSENQLALKVIDPRHLPHNQVAPPVYVDKMVVNHRDCSVNNATLLLDSPRKIEIYYSALSYVIPERVKFRYRLLEPLRSSTVETNDLAAAFRHAAEGCRVSRNVNVVHVLNGTSSNMHPIVRDEIYRIGFEAISDACTRSGGSVVTIELTYDQDVILRVRDDGKGINEELLRHGKQGHFGLKRMRERADRIGANLSLKTAPNHGTEVTLVVPGSVVFKVGKTSKLARFLSVADSSKQQD